MSYSKDEDAILLEEVEEGCAEDEDGFGYDADDFYESNFEVLKMNDASECMNVYSTIYFSATA